MSRGMQARLMFLTVVGFFCVLPALLVGGLVSIFHADAGFYTAIAVFLYQFDGLLFRKVRK